MIICIRSLLHWSLIPFIFYIVNGYFIDNSKIESYEDNYYMIFVNNGNKEQTLKKRQETNKLINEIVNEIQNLIIENKETYENPEKLNEIKLASNFIKRSNNSTISNLVYPVSTVEDSTVLYAYLSHDLVNKVENLNFVKSCQPDSFTEFATNYNIEDIKKNTKWDSVGVKEYSYMHLSLLSQGKFSLNHIDQYDYNYYFPFSAGEGVDIIIMDSGFNFNHSEFSNTNERTAQCTVLVKDGSTTEITNGDCSTKDPFLGSHGECVSDAAAGLDRGVASKANIYGVQLDIAPLLGSIKNIDIIAGLQYISDNLIRPHKTVINFSFGKYFSYTNKTDEFIHYEKLINEISNKGGIMFAAAGNRSSFTVKESSGEAFYPCSFDNVICVGGVEVMNPSVSNEYKVAYECNRGTNIDIYAPYDMDLLYQNNYGIDKEKSTEGTSFSSPLVAGVAATLISEYTDIEFDTTIMLNYLTELGLKDIITNIPKGKGNVFINNGKKIVYSSNDIYYGCGVFSGNLGCNIDEYCSEEGFCTILDTIPTNITETDPSSTTIMENKFMYDDDDDDDDDDDTPIDVGDVEIEEEEEEEKYRKFIYLNIEEKEEEEDIAIDLDLYLDEEGNERFPK